MNDEIKEMLDKLEYFIEEGYEYYNDIKLNENEVKNLLDYITNLKQENKIKDTNWESLKYYLEKLYYKDYIEEAISDDIDKKIKELESKVEIKDYQKDIKALQQENERLKEDLKGQEKLTLSYCKSEQDYKSRCEKAVEYNNQIIKDTKDFYRPTTDIIYSGDSLIEIATNNINILQNGSEKR